IGAYEKPPAMPVDTFFVLHFVWDKNVAQMLVKKCVNSVSTNEYKLKHISGCEYFISIRYVWNMSFVRSVKVMTN
ncbi:hypothetical protein, partial [Vibrio parahaemolyticus]